MSWYTKVVCSAECKHCHTISDLMFTWLSKHTLSICNVSLQLKLCLLAMESQNVHTCIYTCTCTGVMYRHMYIHVNVYVCVRCTIVCVLALEYLVGVYSDRGMNYCIRGLLHIHICTDLLHYTCTHNTQKPPIPYDRWKCIHECIETCVVQCVGEGGVHVITWFSGLLVVTIAWVSCVPWGIHTVRDRNKKRHHFRIVLCGPILESYMYMYIQYTHLALDPDCCV